MGSEKFGRYQVRRVLGAGAFATVYLCRDPDLDSMVAIKVLSETYAQDEDIKNRFVQEARILRRLDSERILRVNTIDRLPDGRPYFVADYADQGTLRSLIRARFDETQLDQPTGGLSQPDGFGLEDAILLSQDIARCLAVAHRQSVVHRDLKPSNVLFRSKDTFRDSEADSGTSVPTMEAILHGDTRMVLADFGIARALEAASGHTIAAGTPQYMAPEQADGQADVRSDLYAASVILYELLTGRTPYAGSSVVEVVKKQLTGPPPPIRSVRPQIPERVEAVVSKGMSIDPEDRYQSAEEWLRRLEDIASEELLSDPTGGDTTTVGDSRETIRHVEGAGNGRPVDDETPPPNGPSGPGRSRLKDVLAKARMPYLVGGVGLFALFIGFLVWVITGSPPTPTGLSAETTLSGVELRWDGLETPTGIEAFLIFRDEEEIATAVGAATTYLDGDVDLALSYRYAIQVRDQRGRLSAVSEPFTSLPVEAPGIPTGLSASVDANSIEINWDPPPDDANVTEYVILRDGEEIAAVARGVTSFTDRNVNTSEPHEYAIEAVATEAIRSGPSTSVSTERFVLALAPFEIVDADLAFSGQIHFYTFEGQDGEFLTFFAESVNERPLSLEVIGPRGDSVDRIEGSTVIALNVRLPESGRYEVLVGLDGGATGGYNIFYTLLEDCPIGSTCEGELLAGRTHEWTFVGQRGQAIAIALLPDTAAPRLDFFGPDGSRIQEFEGAGGNVIVIYETLPTDGDYVVGVEFVSGSGGYRMSVLPWLELQPQVVVDGTLPGPLDDGIFNVHTFDGLAGTLLTATVRSTTGELLIDLVSPEGEVIDVDVGTQSAVISVDLDLNGEYQLRVAFVDGEGEYRLTYDRDLPNTTVGIVDAQISSAGEIDTYPFRARAGETIVVFANSDAGTPRWTLRDLDLNLLAEPVGGLIEYEVLEDGFYFIEVSFDSGTGPYSLVLTRFP